MWRDGVWLRWQVDWLRLKEAKEAAYRRSLTGPDWGGAKRAGEQYLAMEALWQKYVHKKCGKPLDYMTNGLGYDRGHDDWLCPCE